MTSTENPVWLTAKEAAVYLNCSPATLAYWRYKGKGPTFSRMGERLTRYAKADLDAFMAVRA